MKILYLGIDPSRYPTIHELVHHPLIHTLPLPFAGEIERAFAHLTCYTHVLFTSRTAVPIYKEYAAKAGFSLAALQTKTYLSVGRATSQRLSEIGLKIAHTAHEESGEGITALLDTLSLEHAHLFFPRSSLARPLIPHYLTHHQIPFTPLNLYETRPTSLPLPALDPFDLFVFTSPSVVQTFYTLAHTLPPLEKCHFIGPITQKKYLELSSPPLIRKTFL